MKKLLKKIISMGMATALVLAGIAAQPKMTVQAAEEYTAFIMFSDTNWMFGNWDASLESATTKVNGAGTYSVTLSASEVGGDGETFAEGTMLLGVDIIGAYDGMAAVGKSLSVSALTVKADGEEVAVDMSKVLTGDTEGNGDYYIEIYNEYGNTAYNPPIDFENFSFKDSVTIEFTLEETSQSLAYLVFADQDGNYANMDASLESATTSFNGEGYYSVVLDAAEVGGDGETPSNGVQILCVDFLGAQSALADGHSYEVTEVEVLADEEPVLVDLSKVKFGDLEGNGNFRVEIYNADGETAQDPAIDVASLAFASTLEVIVNLELKVEGKPEETTVEEGSASESGESVADNGSETAQTNENGADADSEEESESSSSAFAVILPSIAALMIAGGVAGRTVKKKNDGKEDKKNK